MSPTEKGKLRGIADSETNTTTSNNQEQIKCDECGGKIIQQNGGEKICSKCGLVVEENVIDHGPEWRAFDSKEKNEKSRVGAPMTNQRHDKGLTTKIGNDRQDHYGKTLSNKKQIQIDRLKKWNKRAAATGKERSLRSGLGEISRISSGLGLPDTIRETAAMIYRQAHKRDLLPGRSIDTVAAASVYIATRKCGSPRTPEEIHPLCRTQREKTEREGKKEFNRTYRYLIEELNISVSPADPADHIDRFIDNIDIEKDTSLANTAKTLLDELNGEVLSGIAPSSIAAASIYAANLIEGMDVTQENISNATNVSTVTIRTYYKKILSENQK